MRILLILLLLLIIITLPFQSAKGASASFKASIKGWRPEVQSKIQVLGEFSSCRVVNALKFDNFHSACFLKKESKGWQLESFASQCEVECIKVSNITNTTNTVRFNQINP
jgi:hypothetical protein